VIPRETVDLILDTAQIADVVGDYVTLKRRGANYVACCPFHNEKTPSFYVSPSKGIYKCFGCGKSGTAVGFVMEQEHCSYAEALRYLARKYHIAVVEEEVSPEEIARRQRGESLLLVSEFAQKFFSDNLSRDGEGKAVGYQYFLSRGIEDETIRRFGLGWAPSAKSALVDAARKAGYKDEYIVAAGLAVKQDDGTLADKFRGRAMFPIHSVSGRVIAFSGRTLRSDNPAKYVNSPETEIYIKSRNLLGIYFAKGEISRLDKCILVEGNIDMVMMHQLGLRNTVASCGTSLTVEQIRLIHKFTENITIMYDGDSAGIHAALRGIDMILSEGMNVKIVLLPDGEDPDSFSRHHPLDEVRAYIEQGEKDFITFKSELLLETAGGDPLKKAELINDISDSIAVIPDAVKRSIYAEHVAGLFDIEQSVIFDRVTKTRGKIKREGGREPSKELEEAVQNTVNEENKTLAQVERDLLYFLLSHGRDPLEFESDSPYYSAEEEQRQTVAEFIREALESDGTKMANSAYAAVYDAYFELYDKDLSQDEILKRMLDLPDRGTAEVAASLSSMKYKLSVSAFESALTTVSSWLSSQVPKTIMLYAERRLQYRYDTLVHELRDAPDAEPIMREMMRIQNAQRRIKQETGREKKTE